jgi:flagellar hook-basal body complex protein FliE
MSTPVSSVLAVAPVLGTTPASSLADVQSASSVTSTAGGAGQFANVLASAVDNVQGLQSQSENLAIKAVTGDLTDIHQATIAQTRASLAIELATTMRNRGVEAFNEIMRMQV